MKTNHLVNLSVMAAVIAIVFAVCPTSSYGQDCSGFAYCNPTTGYEIGGLVVLDLPGGAGSNSVAVGYGAMTAPNTGIDNTATGASALQANTAGNHNTANGEVALVLNTTGGDNTAVGTGTLFFNTTGSGNTALGYSSCQTVTNANGVICIGSGVAGANVSNTTYVAGIYNTTLPGKRNPLVCVNSAGQLGTKGCALLGGPVSAAKQEEVNRELQRVIGTQAQQIADLQQRLLQLESLVAKK